VFFKYPAGAYIAILIKLAGKECKCVYWLINTLVFFVLLLMIQQAKILEQKLAFQYVCTT
jgi:hypothetical protein